ncbi:hypothetical protein [Enterococcus mundtii]|uniref:hypothetical protein n=1 Tax=Enterococcus mundtii TaxID=53346 RepID=UPI0003312B1B|nr:hypothetical protein [Enterococcus mundtii]EOH59441.1 hypothetical protein UAC_02839 [Enterococcus mundtii ATCC 882]EOU09352.1 hypothetical protein I587_02962 [Enterococcus mundtii ATCC 882]
MATPSVRVSEETIQMLKEIQETWSKDQVIPVKISQRIVVEALIKAEYDKIKNWIDVNKVDTKKADT